MNRLFASRMGRDRGIPLNTAIRMPALTTQEHINAVRYPGHFVRSVPDTSDTRPPQASTKQPIRRSVPIHQPPTCRSCVSSSRPNNSTSPPTTLGTGASRFCRDGKHVYFASYGADDEWIEVVEGASPASFELLAEAGFARDASRVYRADFGEDRCWVSVVEGADPGTFVAPSSDSAQSVDAT